MSGKKDFSRKVKLKALRCCDRHCCLCNKQCDTLIEIHHITPKDKGGDGSFDNAIPLCFDCHAKVEMYNDRHSIGTKYRAEELKDRRNQIYDKYTSPYLPLVKFWIEGPPTDDLSVLPPSRFKISNLHHYLYCKARVIFKIYQGGRCLKIIKNDDYGGKTLWRLNPNTTVDCPDHIRVELGNKFPKNVDGLRVEVQVILVDKFGWEHELLPVSWIYSPREGWYYEPFKVKKR